MYSITIFAVSKCIANHYCTSLYPLLAGYNGCLLIILCEFQVKMYEIKATDNFLVVNTCGEIQHTPNNLAEFGEIIYWIRHFCSADVL